MFITFALHLHEKCTNNVFLIWLVNFQNCAAIKKSHYGIKVYPYPNILLPGQYMLPYYVIKAFFLKLMSKRGWV